MACSHPNPAIAHHRVVSYELKPVSPEVAKEGEISRGFALELTQPPESRLRDADAVGAKKAECHGARVSRRKLLILQNLGFGMLML